LLLTHEEGKNSQVGSGTEPVSTKEGQCDKQIGGTAAEPYLEQNKDNIPKTGSRTILQTGEIGATTAPKHDPLENQAR